LPHADDNGHRPYPWPALTPREREVLALLAEALTTQQIADRLGRSYWTVRIHQRNIVEKLGAPRPYTRGVYGGGVGDGGGGSRKVVCSYYAATP